MKVINKISRGYSYFAIAIGIAFALINIISIVCARIDTIAGWVFETNLGLVLILTEVLIPTTILSIINLVIFRNRFNLYATLTCAIPLLIFLMAISKYM